MSAFAKVVDRDVSQATKRIVAAARYYAMQSPLFSLAAVAILAALAGDITAGELPTPPVFSIVASDVRTRVYYIYGVNADCSRAELPNTRILEKPRHGMLELIKEEGFTAYPKDSQQYKCNEQRSEVLAFYYASADGFKGKDRCTIEVFFTDGNYRKVVLNVDVR